MRRARRWSGSGDERRVVMDWGVMERSRSMGSKSSSVEEEAWSRE